MTTSSDIQVLQLECERLRQELAAKESQLARAEEEMRRAIAESYALYMTSMDITSQLDLPNTLLSILRRVKQLSGADSGTVLLVDHGSGDLVVSSELGLGRELVGARIKAGQGLAGAALRSGEPMIVEDYQAWANAVSVFKAYGLRAVVALPLHWQGTILGILTLHHRIPEARFSLDDLDSLQHVTVQAAIAIHNAQRYNAERERNHHLTTLYQAATRIAGSLELDAVLRTAVDSLVEALQVPVCVIYENRPHAGMTVLASHLTHASEAETVSHVHRAFIPPSVEALIDDGHWLVLQRNDPLLQPDVQTYMDYRSAESMLMLPIPLGQRTIGLIELSVTGTQRRFQAAAIETAMALAAHIGVAIRHAQLHHQLHAQRVNEQATLLRLTRQLLGTHHEQQVIQEAMQALIEAFDTPFVHLMLTEGDLLHSRVQSGFERLDSRVWRRGDGSIFGYAAQTGEMCIVDDMLTESRFPDDTLLRDLGLRSCIVAPMIYSETVVGVMAVSRSEPRGFTNDDARLLSLLAYQISVALDRAQLFESAQAYNNVLEARIAERTREIRAAQERAEAILQAAGEALIVFDQDGCVDGVNPAFEAQHGYSAAEVRGLSSKDLFGFDLLTRAQFNDGLRVWRGDMPIPRRDNSTYDAAITLSPVLNTAGEQTGIIASLRDISYLKEIERMKDAFVSNVSHELRTPLANIKLYFHLLMHGNEGKREHYSATLQREMERLHVLIEDLLALSRLDQDRVQMPLIPTDVNSVISTLVADRQRMAHTRGLHLHCQIYPEPLITLADARMLTQALGNLLANAMNYTPSGGMIRVDTWLEAHAAQSFIVISVADNGLGMSETDQAHLFDRFFRGTAAQSTGAAGTGLGMSIVQEIMVRHGGSIDFHSEQGSGTTFFLRLPVRS